MLKVKFINLQSPTVFSSLFEDLSVTGKKRDAYGVTLV